MNKIILFLLWLPTLLLAQSDSLNISWNRNPETNMSHYLLERKIDTGTFTQIANVPHPTSGTTVGPYGDHPTVPLTGHRYGYRVRAVNILGVISLYSNEVGTGIPLITTTGIPATITGGNHNPIG
jgi:hypothetical protein